MSPIEVREAQQDGNTTAPVLLWVKPCCSPAPKNPTKHFPGWHRSRRARVTASPGLLRGRSCTTEVVTRLPKCSSIIWGGLGGLSGRAVSTEEKCCSWPEPSTWHPGSRLRPPPGRASPNSGSRHPPSPGSRQPQGCRLLLPSSTFVRWGPRPPRAAQEEPGCVRRLTGA